MIHQQPGSNISGVSKHQSPVPQCSHSKLTVGPCLQVSCYEQPSSESAFRASTPISRITANTNTATPRYIYSSATTFPAPLILPGDELDWDPKYRPQTLRQWKACQKDTSVTASRKTIYIITYPEMRNKDIRDRMRDWELPTPPGSRDNLAPTGFPVPSQILQYLQAFYHGMAVKEIPGWQWSLWNDSEKDGYRTAKPRAQRHVTSNGKIALLSPAGTLYRVRHRPSPDHATTQLCLSDILDALVDTVPSDAHAILATTKQDLYEDEEDDFCCGRAYGGSRVAVASAFRYHPFLDQHNKIDDFHSWPTSHCASYTAALCSKDEAMSDRDSVLGAIAASVSTDAETPIGAAVTAAAPLVPRDSMQWERLHLARFCRTVSHEIGHCLALGHCTYYACVMQGTATIAEDARQPPYLCPVCLEKLSVGLSPLLESHKDRSASAKSSKRGGDAEKTRIEQVELQKRWIKGRYEAIMHMCGEFEANGMFAAWKVWVGKRLEQINHQESIKTENA